MNKNVLEERTEEHVNAVDTQNDETSFITPIKETTLIQPRRNFRKIGCAWITFGARLTESRGRASCKVRACSVRLIIVNQR